MRWLPIAIAGIALAAGCDAGKTKQLGGNNLSSLCAPSPTAPPSGFDPFYDKYLDADGIPVLSSGVVADTAVSTACNIVKHMLSLRDDVRQAMIAQQQRVAVIGVDEFTTDIPEYANLYAMFPGGNWDRLRGVGATLQIPVASVGEENLLCLQDDVFAGETLLIQTFATAVLLGVDDVDSNFESELQTAYDAATGAGLWRDTYASANRIEYYAEGVQSWFDANPDVSPPDGTHNDINTRAELRAYDPPLAALIAETMPDDAWRPRCP